MRERLVELLQSARDFAEKQCEENACSECPAGKACDVGFIADHLIANGITLAEDINVPCKIGDAAWVIRSYKGKKHLQKGIISEMFFTDHMELMIVVKHIGRGIWGKSVFGTLQDGQKVLGVVE